MFKIESLPPLILEDLGGESVRLTYKFYSLSNICTSRSFIPIRSLAAISDISVKHNQIELERGLDSEVIAWLRYLQEESNTDISYGSLSLSLMSPVLHHLRWIPKPIADGLELSFTYTPQHDVAEDFRNWTLDEEAYAFKIYSDNNAPPPNLSTAFWGLWPVAFREGLNGTDRNLEIHGHEASVTAIVPKLFPKDAGDPLMVDFTDENNYVDWSYAGDSFKALTTMSCTTITREFLGREDAGYLDSGTTTSRVCAIPMNRDIAGQVTLTFKSNQNAKYIAGIQTVFLLQRKLLSYYEGQLYLN